MRAALEAERAGLLAEIARLKDAADEFTSMIGELDHAARRVRDGLERTGGIAPDLERKRTSLDENRKIAALDADAVRQRLAAARARLQKVEAEIAEGNS